MDVIAWAILLLFTIAILWKIGLRTLSQIPRGEATMELRLPHWPFLAAIVGGLFMACVTTTIRLWRILRHNEGLESHESVEADDIKVTSID